MNPYDNIHAGWSMSVNHNDFASAGCQVVVGFPHCEQLHNEPDRGAWKVFKESAYGIDQHSFPYLLLYGVDAQKVALAGSQKLSPRLRFGSRGPLVSDVQTRLKALGFYEGIIDTGFGHRTTRAILDFQTAKFGSGADDGIVGSVTAAALGVPWADV
jgi:putative peptidoglycan binding protein